MKTKQFLLTTLLLSTLIVVSCSETSTNSLSQTETSKSSLIGTWININDTIWTMNVTLIGNTYDTNYIPQKSSHYWDTITFIDSTHCITGVALKDTQTYWFQDTLSTRYIIIRGLEDHKWIGQTAFPFEKIGSCIIMKPYIYSKID